MHTPDDFLRTFGVSDETIARSHEMKAALVPPNEGDVIAATWAVDLSIADDRMIPADYEQMNGVMVPRPSKRNDDGSYLLQPSRVKRGTCPLTLSTDDARQARARYLLWHSYYVRAYAARHLTFTEQDAARRLYWGGNEPPPDPRKMLIDSEIQRAIQTTLKDR